MAHYAKLGINSKVIAVHVVADKDCKNADGIEDEEVGRQFLENIFNCFYFLHYGHFINWLCST